MDQTFEKRKKVIYDFICDDFYIPMKVKEIATVLQVSKEQRRELQEVLDALVEEGKITLSKRGKYSKGQAKRITISPRCATPICPLSSMVESIEPDKR